MIIKRLSYSIGQRHVSSIIPRKPALLIQHFALNYFLFPLRHQFINIVTYTLIK